MLVLRRSVRRAATVGVYGTARPHPRLDIHSYGAPLVHFTPSLSSSRSPSAGSFSNDVVSSSFVHKRFMSSSSASSVSRDNEEEEDVTPEEPEQQPVLIYEGPMARAVRLMKGVSVTSCILTSIGMPTLCLISEQSASMVGKVWKGFFLMALASGAAYQRVTMCITVFVVVCCSGRCAAPSWYVFLHERCNTGGGLITFAVYVCRRLSV